MRISAEIVKEFLSYDPETGIVTWIKNRGSNDIVGKVAGYTRQGYKHGYVDIKINDKIYLAHHIAWVLMTGSWPTQDIDHINLIRNDNRWCNLREVSRSKNLHNSGPRKRNTSGYKGIKFVPKGRRKWCAMVMINYKQHYIGVFNTVEEAVAARNKYCQNLLGENYKFD